MITDNFKKYFSKPILATDPDFNISSGFWAENFRCRLAAVRSAINNIGKIVLADHMEHCIAEAVEHGDHEALDRFNDAIAKFLK